jgi:hypothetical protein
MLDPRMVAARIHRPDALEQGIALDRPRISASSHGERTKVDMQLSNRAKKEKCKIASKR